MKGVPAVALATTAIVVLAVGVYLLLPGRPAGKYITSPIGLVTSTGTSCISVKEDVVHANSYDDVEWLVTADPKCGFEGQTVEIAFLNGGHPGNCNCSAPIKKNVAKNLRLKVDKHLEHTPYDYEIRVAGKTIYDPRLEVDP